VDSTHLHKLLVCANGSEQSQRAAAFVGKLIKSGDSITIYAGFVLPPLTMAHRNGEKSYELEMQACTEKAKTYVLVAKEILLQNCNGNLIDNDDNIREFIEGSNDPRTAVIAFAGKMGCHTIACGSRGLGIVKGALLGSFSTHLVQNATHHAVLVVQ
jgi:nucleotide-binding universal stress UspA family protein